MSASTTETKQRLRRTRTVADLAADLGDVPIDRILLEPAPGRATARDLLRLVEVDKFLCELVDGALVEKPMGFEESSLSLWLAHQIRIYLTANNIGELFGSDGPFRLAPKLIRLPDLAFVRWENLPDEAEWPAIGNLAPDLAVEVISPSNTRKEMARKRREYFRAGTTLVWEVFPRRRKIEVYTSTEERRVLGIGDVLEGGELLPEFRLPLHIVFGRPGRPRRKRT